MDYSQVSKSNFQPSKSVGTIKSVSNKSINEFNNAMRDSAKSACTVKNYAHNIAVGATVGVGAGAGPCVVTTGAYLGCVGLAGLSGAAGGAFQSAVECTMEKLDKANKKSSKK